MTMQALTDYSDAWDREGEREDAKQEARDVLAREADGGLTTRSRT